MNAQQPCAKTFQDLQRAQIEPLGDSADEDAAMPEADHSEQPTATMVDPSSTREHTELAETSIPIRDDREKYRVEVGLTRGTTAVRDQVKRECLGRHIDNPRKVEEVEAILDTCLSLEFGIVKYQLLEFLGNRLSNPGSRVEINSTWNLTDPNMIFDALQTISNTNLDSKIHRVYGQMRLFNSVMDKANSAVVKPDFAMSKIRGTGTYLAEHLIILEQLAKDHAGPVTKKERERKFNSYRSEFTAGKRWKQVVEWFGGSGVILIFVCAGM